MPLLPSHYTNSNLGKSDGVRTTCFLPLFLQCFRSVRFLFFTLALIPFFETKGKLEVKRRERKRASINFSFESKIRRNSLDWNPFNLVPLGGKEVEGKVTVRIGLVLLLDYAITVEGERWNQQTSAN